MVYKQAYTFCSVCILELVFASWCLWNIYSAISQHSFKWMEVRLVLRSVSLPHLPKPHSLAYLGVWLWLNAVKDDEWFMYWLLELCRRRNELYENMMCGLQASGIYFAKIHYHHKLWIICVFDHIQRRLKASVFVHANFSSHSLLVTGAFFFFYFLFIFPSSFYLCHILSCYPSPTL